MNGIGYGFFIPIFFVVSGAGIDPSAVAKYPLVLVAFIVMLLLVRALPIYISMGMNPETKDIDSSGRATVALYWRRRCRLSLR